MALVGGAESTIYGPSPDYDWYRIQCLSADINENGERWTYWEMISSQLWDDCWSQVELLKMVFEHVTNRIRRQGFEPGEWLVYGGWWPVVDEDDDE